MTADICGLHHVGHVVADLGEALALYRRLGFVVPAPSWPAMAPRSGAAPEPFGAANTHADFAENFVEVAGCVRAGDTAGVPDDARLVPLTAPAAVLPTLLARIAETTASLGTFLDRFEGLHILMFAAADLDAAADRLTAAGVRHAGVNTVRRPTTTGTETVRYLEIDDPAASDRPGTVGEGRVGLVAALDPQVQAARCAEHPNGAVRLAGAVLCVPDVELDGFVARYSDYLGRSGYASSQGWVFELGGARLTLTDEAGLATLLPGERPVAQPALAAYTVAVRDLDAARRLLQDNGFRLGRTASGEAFVPAAQTLGAAVVFAPADS